MPKTKGLCKRNFQIAMNEILNCGQGHKKAEKPKEVSVEVIFDLNKDRKKKLNSHTQKTFMKKEIFLTSKHYRQVDILELLSKDVKLGNKKRELN